MTYRKSLTCLAAALMLGTSGWLFAARDADPSQAQDKADRTQDATADSKDSKDSGDAAQPAGSRSGGKSAARAGSKEMDQKFVKHAADIGMFEVEAARLAQQHAKDQKVKDLARHILNDHQKANDELKQFAESKGMELPQELMPVSQAKLDALKEMQGEDFDRAYLYCNVSGHAMALLCFRDAANEAQDSDLRSWAKSQMAPLQQHLTHAGELARWDEVDPRGQGGAATAGSKERASADACEHCAGLQVATADHTCPVCGVRLTAATDRTEGAATPPRGDRQNPGARENATEGQPGVGGDSDTPSGGSTNERLPGTDDGNRQPAAAESR